MRKLAFTLLIMVLGCGEDEPAVGNNEVVDGTVETSLDATTVETSLDATTGETEATSATETTADSAADSAPEVAETNVADTTEVSDATEADTNDVAAETETVAGTCANGDECAMCAFPTKVASAADCYCVFCPTTPMLASECSANTASWNQFCNPWPGPDVCPVASCIPKPAPLCESGQCVENPNGCFGAEECGSCNFARPPETPEDCQCPGCPQPLAVDYCAVIEQAIADVCADFDYDACLRPPCAVPPLITCGEDWTCGYGEGGPADR